MPSSARRLRARVSGRARLVTVAGGLGVQLLLLSTVRCAAAGVAAGAMGLPAFARLCSASCRRCCAAARTPPRTWVPRRLLPLSLLWWRCVRTGSTPLRLARAPISAWGQLCPVEVTRSSRAWHIVPSRCWPRPAPHMELPSSRLFFSVEWLHDASCCPFSASLACAIAIAGDG